MSSSPFGVESLETRRLLSATIPTLHIPFTDLTVAIPNLPGGSAGQVTHQAPVNGDFSANSFTGWQTAGNDTVQLSDFHSIPDGKADQAAISNGTQPSSGTLPTTAANLESFLGLNAGDLSAKGSTAVNGSAIKQTITAKAGDLVTFKADMLTNEATLTGRDYALVSVTYNGKTQYFKITGVLKATNPLDSSGLSSETGYHSYAILLPKSGQYTIGFGVVNVGDATVASNLLVDNVQLKTRFADLFDGFGGRDQGRGNDQDFGHDFDGGKNPLFS